jgi:ABC-type phosphate transport system auxiliary subunit
MIRVPDIFTRLMAADKWLHIGLGLVWLCAAAVSWFVLQLFGLGAFLAYHTTTFALLYEANQAIRGEGQPDLLDAVATAAPGWVAWAVIELI